MESMQDDFLAALGEQIKILLASTRRIFRLHSRASIALVRLSMSVRLPSRRLIRYIRGHFGSATMRGFMVGGLRAFLSVTLCGFSPSVVLMVAVTLRTASGAPLGRVTATLMGVARSRARCAAFLQRGLQ